MDYSNKPKEYGYELEKSIVDDMFSKSNMLISSKYNSSLMENKIITISLATSDTFKLENGALVSELSASYIKKMLNISSKSGSFYRNLNDAAQNMLGRVIGTSNPDTNSFVYMAFITMAEYRNGVLRITYNQALTPYLKNLQSKFTKLSLSAMLSFRSVYAIRLYELIKSKSYMSSQIPFSLSELKLELGIVDVEEDDVKRVLMNKENPDYDKAVGMAKEQKFTLWTDFRRKVLDIAVNEINNNPRTDIHISYNTEKNGKGGKVVMVIFEIEPKDAIEPLKPEEDLKRRGRPKKISQEDKIKCFVEASKHMADNFSTEEVIKIVEAAKYDLEKITQAYEYMLGYSTPINNKVGFMCEAVKKNWAENVSNPVVQQADNRQRVEENEDIKYGRYLNLLSHKLAVNVEMTEEEMKEFSMLDEHFRKNPRPFYEGKAFSSGKGKAV